MVLYVYYDTYIYLDISMYLGIYLWPKIRQTSCNVSAPFAGDGLQIQDQILQG